MNPKLAKEWHPKKNGNLTPKDVTPGSEKKVWWRCGKNKNHEWEAIIYSRNNGNGCPSCFSQTSELELRVYTEMKYVFHDFYDIKHRKKSFGYECDIYIPKLKFGIEIDSVYTHKYLNDKYSSDKKKTEELSRNGVTLLRLRENGLKTISKNNDVFWSSKMLHDNICCSALKRILDLQELDEDLVSRIKAYIKEGKIQNDIEFVSLLAMLPSPLLPEDSLEYCNKSIAKEWHKTKNGSLTPKDVVPGSHKKVWWVCSKKHNWEASIDKRNNGRGCPYCAGKKACIDNCLKTINPKLAKEWHPTKNGSLTPKDVTPGSSKKVWWQCSKNKSHEWKAIIYNRNKGKGCLYCFKKRRQLVSIV